MDFLSLLSTVVPVFLMISAGYGVYRAGWLSENADTSLLRLLVNLLFPCLILSTVMANAAVVRPANIFLPPALGFLTVGASFALAYFAAPLFGLREPRQRRSFAFTVGLPNYGYIALPVVQTLFGPGTTAVLLIHNVGVETCMWTFGIMLLSGTPPRHAWKHIFSVPVLAIVLALTLHFTGAQTWLPRFFLSAVGSLGVTAIPLGLVMTGATFADQIKHLGQSSAGASGLGSCLLRLGLLPLLLLASMRLLPLSTELRQVLMVQAAMPAAVIPVILTKHYGGDPGLSLRIVLITSALGFVTIPLWLKLGLHLLES